MSERTKVRVLFGATGLLALLVGGYFGFALRDGSPPETNVEINGVVLSAPRQLPHFELVDGNGSTFTSEDFRGSWSFVYFGYTYCPDVCPMSLVEMATLKKQVDSAGFDGAHRYFLMSVDPDRDTAARVGEYVEYFDAGFEGLTGKADQIDVFAQAAGIAYHVPEDRSDPNYLVGHSSIITLINPAGQVHAFFTSPLDGNTIADDFLKIVD